MAERHGRAIRVQLDDTKRDGDVDALRKWLEREQPLDEMVRAENLRIYERASTKKPTDETGAPMGVGTEIVIQLIGAAGGVVFHELLEEVRRSVAAWRDHRREVEDGEPPLDSIDPLDGDG